MTAVDADCTAAAYFETEQSPLKQGSLEASGSRQAFFGRGHGEKNRDHHMCPL